jgi:uncharacterized membrane protein
MYETLLFFHVLAAFFLVSGVVMYSAFALGSPVNRMTRLVAESLWGAGALGTIAFGIWIALNRPEYSLADGWIIAALVLWVLAMGSGARASRGMRAPGDDSAITVDRGTLFAHWMRVLYVVLLLVDMIFKPWT